MQKYILETIVFISGAVLMIFELVGSRMFAPYLGTSLVVWTSIIGVIMGSLSLGYYLGGKLSDRKPHLKILAIILFVAAIAISLSAASQYMILGILMSLIHDLRVSSFIGSLLLFAPASVIFGMVSPYAIKLKLNSLKDSGKKIGEMYAISTVGSIVGTFLGGFYMLPIFGTRNILLILIAIMVLVGIITWLIAQDKFKKKDFLVMTILAISFFSLGAIFSSNHWAKADIDTLYNRVLIFDTIDKKTGRPMRAYTTDPHGAHSAIFLDQDNDLVFDYLKAYRLANFFHPEIKEALMIGGGAYTYPRDFLKRNPQANLDIVEIDDKLEQIAKTFFNLKDDERVKIYNQDGRTYLNKNTKKYDCVFMDAYNSRFSIPFQLTTKETVEEIYNSLNDQGIVLANIISGIEGDSGKFLRAEIATYKTKFPQILVFPLKKEAAANEAQNILLVAIKSDQPINPTSDNPEYSLFLNNLWTSEIKNDLPVLTDDFAPVDYYTLSLF